MGRSAEGPASHARIAPRHGERWSGAVFRLSAEDAGHYRALEFVHGAAVPFRIDAHALASIPGATGDANAARGEPRVLPAARGYPAPAAERARRAVTRFRSWLAVEGWHEIEVDAAMRIRHVTRGGAALLGAALATAGWRAGAALPPALASWLRRRGPGAPAGASRTVVRGRRQFVLRGLPAIEGDGWLLYVNERPAAATAVPEPLSEVPPLSPREHEVLVWVAAGKTDAQAAAILGISVRTVQKHLENVYVKLGVEGRTAAVMRARIATASR